MQTPDVQVLRQHRPANPAMAERQEALHLSVCQARRVGDGAEAGTTSPPMCRAATTPLRC